MLGVNVAGEAARVRVEAQLARWRLTPEWLTASAAACGVTNRYARPTQLGADRWASLIAAWRRSTATDLFPPACVVVNAGTAVTIDALDANGVFHGGLILPGMRLMLEALAEKTAGLKIAARCVPAVSGQHRGRDLLRIGPGDLRRDRAHAPAHRFQSGARPMLSGGRRRAGDRRCI